MQNSIFISKIGFPFCLISINFLFLVFNREQKLTILITYFLSICSAVDGYRKSVLEEISVNIGQLSAVHRDCVKNSQRRTWRWRRHGRNYLHLTADKDVVGSKPMLGLYCMLLTRLNIVVDCCVACFEPKHTTRLSNGILIELFRRHFMDALRCY